MRAVLLRPSIPDTMASTRTEKTALLYASMQPAFSYRQHLIVALREGACAASSVDRNA